MTMFFNKILLISIMSSSSFFTTSNYSINRLVGTWHSNDTGVMTTFVFYHNNSFEYIGLIDEGSEPEILKGSFDLNKKQLLLTFEHGASGTYEIEQLNSKVLILQYNGTLIYYNKNI